MEEFVSNVLWYAQNSKIFLHRSNKKYKFDLKRMWRYNCEYPHDFQESQNFSDSNKYSQYCKFWTLRGSIIWKKILVMQKNKDTCNICSPDVRKHSQEKWYFSNAETYSKLGLGFWLLIANVIYKIRIWLTIERQYK